SDVRVCVPRRELLAREHLERSPHAGQSTLARLPGITEFETPRQLITRRRLTGPSFVPADWRHTMPRYLITASYTPDGAKGLWKEGGSARRAAAEQAMKSVGAKIEAFYFAFGDNDAYVIVDAPDNATIAAASVAINASGGVHSKTVVLMTAEEMDQITKK